ncbi:hypothetical protein HDV00_005020 [Rhizophlyctis rosea]|nr:hypothetical protein HDV00_005020 [Rhizophlyctis rosea]
MPPKDSHDKDKDQPKEWGKDDKIAQQVAKIMFGAGDVQNPSADTVHLMEDMLLDYWAHLATKVNKISTGARITTNHFLQALQDDPKKLARAQELLHMSQELVQARSLASDVPEMAGGKMGDGVRF